MISKQPDTPNNTPKASTRSYAPGDIEGIVAKLEKDFAAKLAEQQAEARYTETFEGFTVEEQAAITEACQGLRPGHLDHLPAVRTGQGEYQQDYTPQLRQHFEPKPRNAERDRTEGDGCPTGAVVGMVVCGVVAFAAGLLIRWMI